MRVDIYKNLHKDCWSLRSKEGETYGKVIDHATEFDLFGCSFIVGEKGRQRVIKTRHKNVHAMVRGNTVVPYPNFFKINGSGLDFLGEVSYNPYGAGYFFTMHDGAPIKEATLVKFFKDKVLAYN